MYNNNTKMFDTDKSICAENSFIALEINTVFNEHNLKFLFVVKGFVSFF